MNSKKAKILRRHAAAVAARTEREPGLVAYQTKRVCGYQAPTGWLRHLVPLLKGTWLAEFISKCTPVFSVRMQHNPGSYKAIYRLLKLRARRRQRYEH
ncbi:MAG: hypothetical protein M0P95_17855 [Sulfuritalea sp.]|jgi:hypothetical protein|nr:hypothetical protein [Sulfuritalea sp.]